MGTAAEQLLHHAAYQRHPRRSAHQHHLVDISGLQLAVGQRHAHRTHGALQNRLYHALEFSPRDFAHVFAAVRQRHQDRRAIGFGKLMLGRDQGLAQLLHNHRMRRQIQPVPRADLLPRHREQLQIQIISAQVRVAVRCQHLVDVALPGRNQLQNRNVECPAAQVVHRHAPALLLVQSVGQSRRGRLVHQPQHFKSGQPAGVARRLSLRVVEIRRNGNHRAVHRIAEMLLGPALQLAQNERGNLRRREHTFAQPHANRAAAFRIDLEREKLQLLLNILDPAPHQPLHGIDAALRLRQQAAASRLAHQNISAGVHADHRGAQRRAVRPRDAPRPPLARIV